MKKKFNRLLALPAVIMFMGLCMSMTDSIDPRSMTAESSSASGDYSVFMVVESWTWSELAGSALVGGLGGAVGGAAAGTLACGAGAGPGALAGAVAGAVGGAVEYAGTQAWHAVFGDAIFNPASTLAYTEIALD